MFHWTRTACMVAGFALALQATAAAQDQSEGPLMAKLVVERVEVDEESKKEVMSPAKNAFPGDVLQYTGRYTNLLEEPLSGLVINGPIPDNTVFAEEGLSVSHHATFEVLVEGESWQELPAFKTVKKEDGTTERVPAEPADYSQIRWRLADPLDPEATLVTVYRVKVDE